MIYGPGFYKLDGVLLYGPNMVINNNYQLYKDKYETYTYPADGWYWFDSLESACNFFGSDKNNYVSDVTDFIGS